MIRGNNRKRKENKKLWKMRPKHSVGVLDNAFHSHMQDIKYFNTRIANQ